MASSLSLNLTDPVLVGITAVIFTMIAGFVVLQFINCLANDTKPNSPANHPSSSINHNNQQKQVIQRSRKRPRLDAIYYVPCMNYAAEWSRFYPTTTYRKTCINAQCLVCGKKDINHMHEDVICYECDANDGCWCCSRHCYSRLLLRHTSRCKALSRKCYPYYIGYARDCMRGYTDCKLNVYRSDYELYVQYLIIGYLRCDDIHMDCVRLIAVYLFNAKITCFDMRHLRQSPYLSVDAGARQIYQIKQESGGYAAAYSNMVLQRDGIYYAVVQVLECEMNGFYIGIIPAKYGTKSRLPISITNIANCYVYGSKGNYFYRNHALFSNVLKNRRFSFHRRFGFMPQDVLKIVVDLQFGALTFIDMKNANKEPVSFRINKDIEYRLLVATCHHGDAYKLC